MSATLPPALRSAATGLVADLREVFGERLLAVVAYGPRLDEAASGPPLTTLALTDLVGYADLSRAVERAPAWDRAGLAMPLLLGREEFARSFDAFPFEYDDILSRHAVLYGVDPLEGLQVKPGDLRRACEAVAKGHLIHLREGFLETRGRAVDLAALIKASAAPFETLLFRVARLRGVEVASSGLADAVAGIARTTAPVVSEVLALVGPRRLSNDEARRLFPAYLAAVEELVAYVDRWTE
jgi:hypothetical protein